MALINGTWKKVATINPEAMLKNMGEGSSPEELAALKSEIETLGEITEIKITDDKANIKMVVDGKVKMEYDFEFGKDTELTTEMGTCMFKSILVSDTKIETTETWDGKVYKSAMRLEDDKLCYDHIGDNGVTTNVSERV